MIHHHGKYRIARGTLARHSSGRLDSRDANQPSEYANPNVAARPCDPATERPRPPRAPLSRGSARWKPATRRPCLRSPQGPRLTRPRVDTCELDSCLRSCSILQRTFLSLSPDQVPLPIVRHPGFLSSSGERPPHARVDPYLSIPSVPAGGPLFVIVANGVELTCRQNKMEESVSGAPMQEIQGQYGGQQEEQEPVKHLWEQKKCSLAI
jgi:hypothetical protein